MASSAAERIIAYNRKTKEYLGYDCCGGTKKRVWAWSGNMRQAANMVKAFPAAADYDLFWDGEEHQGRPLRVK